MATISHGAENQNTCNNPWVSMAVMGLLAALGYQNCRVGVKCDNERAIVAIRNALTRAREAPTVQSNVPVREPTSNGAMGRAIRT